MILLHNIGERVNSNYNTLEEIRESQGNLSFDGVYKSVCSYRAELASLGRRILLFIGGDTVGKDNAFDIGMPFEKFCSWDELFALKLQFGFELGWHSWSHRDLTKLSDQEVMAELKAPFPMETFAYPYGAVDDRVAALVEKAGYACAYSVRQGDGSRFQLKRDYLNW